MRRHNIIQWNNIVNLSVRRKFLISQAVHKMQKDGCSAGVISLTVEHLRDIGHHPEDKNNKASTIDPHHCSKILFENEDSHSKKS